jgi:iron(III) transport system ATP-binding protein
VVDFSRIEGIEPVAVAATGIEKRFGATEVLRCVDLDVGAGSVVVLLGPSGCGKTTLLRILAGLERPDRGEVVVDGRVLTGDDTFVAPEKRRIGMVFQDWALFPHLSVGANVGYGLDRATRRTGRVADALELVGLTGLGDRAPGTLSGGQQQRVALARALAPRPSVLLLDEPFSNLDSSLRVQVRAEVHRLLTGLGITAVFVTHDQDEAFVLGDLVAVMRAGRIEQAAAPSELYAAPATPWVARFVGEANLVAGTGTGAAVDTAVGPVTLRQHARGPLQVLLRPEAIELVVPGPGVIGTSGTVELVEYYGHDSMSVVRTGAGDRLRVRSSTAERFVAGEDVVARYTGPPATAWAAVCPADDDSAATGTTG